jgi:hypothetical protein
VLDLAESEGISTSLAADRYAERRLDAARAAAQTT